MTARPDHRKLWADQMMTLHREAGGMICFEILTPDQELPPLCLCCETGWCSEEESPAAFLLIRPWQRRGSVWSLIGICDACVKHSDLHDRCTAFVKSIWPDGRVIRNVHPAPERKQ